MSVRISLAQLRAVAAHRASGYLDEVIRSGRVEDDVLLLEPDTYLALRKKFSAQPSIFRKGSTALRATGRVASAILSGNKITVSKEEKKRRLAICRSCEFFRDTPVQHCLKCGCALNLKTRLETEHCPIQKW